jgi:hypothetical protein
MPVTSDTSSGGSLSGLLQQNLQRLVDRNQGAILTDINKVIDAAGNSVGISIGAADSNSHDATTTATNSPLAQSDVLGYAAVAAVVLLAVFLFAAR